MKSNLFFIKLSLFLLFFFCNLNYASPYFICGPDEDGCYDEIYDSCSCIPVNEAYFNKPFCLNEITLTCAPLAETPNCPHSAIYPNQNECFAVIFHSISSPPCQVTTEEFCLENNSYFCASDGNPLSCHK